MRGKEVDMDLARVQDFKKRAETDEGKYQLIALRNGEITTDA